MKRTPWFPCSTPPVRVGWYDAKIGTTLVDRRFFDGLRWFYEDGYTLWPSIFGQSRVDFWRGLAEKPE